MHPCCGYSGTSPEYSLADKFMSGKALTVPYSNSPGLICSMTLPRCFHETPIGVLHPVLGYITQEGHGTVGVCPEEAIQMIRELEYLP